MNNPHKKKNKTEIELDNGLRKMVAEYIFMRHTNGCITDVIKQNIDRIIRTKKLRKGKVWFCFGDPDNPETKDEVIKKVYKFLNVPFE